jgi:uncharacterized membrane protein
MKSRWLGTAVAAAMWAFALAVYARLPARVPTHWDLHGQVNGWMARPWGAVMLPLAATLLLGVLWLLPRIDPRRANIEHSRESWRLLVNLILLFLAALEATTLGYALGWPVDADRVIIANVGLLLAAIGNYLPRLRSNWFMGIRTPWTMDNERVWRATHRVGGRTFVAGGLVMALSAVLPEPSRIWIAGAAVAFAAGVPLVYSYVAWRREMAGRPI